MLRLVRYYVVKDGNKKYYAMQAPVSHHPFSSANSRSIIMAFACTAKPTKLLQNNPRRQPSPLAYYHGLEWISRFRLLDPEPVQLKMRQIVISAASDSFEIPYQENAIEQQIYVIVFAEMPSKCNPHTELWVETKKQKKKSKTYM